MKAYIRVAWMGCLLLLPTSLWAGALQTSLQNYFKQGIYFQGAKAELVKVIRLPKIQGAVRWKMPRLSRHAGIISLIAEQGKGQHLQRWYVPVKLRWWANVVTARQELPIRALLQPSMLQVEYQDVADHTGHWWKDIQALKGMRLTRPMHAHKPIYTSMVKRPPLIKRGEIITILAGNHGFSVRAAGQAMKSAGLGERVLVQNMRSKQRIEGVVIDAHTVRVQI